MSSDLTSLYKILKDENRQQIIKLLHKKGSLSYTELLEASATGSTGLLNYHLKALGDLIAKDEAGQYLLTDKGKVALSVLLNFPTEANFAQKRRAQKIFWSLLAVGQVILFAVVAIYYSLGLVDVTRLTEAIVGFVTGMFLAFFGYKMMINVPATGSDRMKKRMKIVYPLGGAWVGFALGFFLIPLLLATFSRPLLRYYLTDWFFVLMLTVPPVLGAYWGYWMGKRNGFNKPKWAVWLDEKTGFA